MSPEEYLTNVILNLGEVETLELIHVLNSERDPPPFRKGEFRPRDVREWIGRNRDILVISLTRIIDFSDEAIAYLFRLGVLPISKAEVGSESALQIKFFAVPDRREDLDIVSSQTFALSDLTASSALLCEICFEVAATNHSFGLTLDPPLVNLQRGSLQYTVGGGLLASGVALVIACGAGLVVAPLGFVGGGVLACTGVVDLALGWRKAVAETRKLRAEAYKLLAEARKLDAEARKLDVEADELEHKRFAEDVYHYRSFAYSKLVPRDVVLREAERLGLEEGYANHILNRVLPKYQLMGQHFHRVTRESDE
jgi:hypothetical protein